MTLRITIASPPPTLESDGPKRKKRNDHSAYGNWFCDRDVGSEEWRSRSYVGVRDTTPTEAATFMYSLVLRTTSHSRSLPFPDLSPSTPRHRTGDLGRSSGCVPTTDKAHPGLEILPNHYETLRPSPRLRKGNLPPLLHKKGPVVVWKARLNPSSSLSGAPWAPSVDSVRPS